MALYNVGVENIFNTKACFVVEADNADAAYNKLFVWCFDNNIFLKSGHAAQLHTGNSADDMFFRMYPRIGMVK